MVDGLISTRADVRQATPEDMDELRLLLGWSERSHLRFQTSRLAQMLAGGLIHVVLRDGRVAGFFYVTVDYPYSMVRGLVVRPGQKTERIVETAVDWAVTACQSVDALGISFIGDDRWLVPHLERSGFTRAGEIVGLHRAGSYLPREGNLTSWVRPAEGRDLDAIVEVDWSAFALTWRNGPQTTREFLAQMPHFLVAEEQGRVVGYVCGTNQGRSGHVVRLAVHQDVQRRGVGTRLLREILQRMSGTGVRGLSLNTQRENVQSQLFYRSLGFSLSRRPTSVYRLDFQDK